MVTTEMFENLIMYDNKSIYHTVYHGYLYKNVTISCICGYVFTKKEGLPTEQEVREVRMHAIENGHFNWKYTFDVKAPA